MRWDVALALRLLLHTTAWVLGIILGLIGSFGLVIAFFGTGGFTADPPPDHVEILPLITWIGAFVAAEFVVYWTWRKLIRLIDAAEAK